MQFSKNLHAFRFQQMPKIGGVFAEIAERFKPFSQAIHNLVGDEKTAKRIKEIGLVPHPVLWPYFDDELLEEYSDAASFVAQNWCDLKTKLEISPEDTFQDKRLLTLYNQMMNAHDRGEYEIVFAALPTLFERSVRLAQNMTVRKSVSRWIKEDVGELPFNIIGYKGFRIWRVVTDNTFASIYTEADADALHYPNRHISAHGVGSQPTDIVKSLNTILLSHYVINLAYAAFQYQLEIEEAA